MQVFRQVQGILADPGEQSRAACPLPASSIQVQAWHRGETAPVQQVRLRVFGLGNGDSLLSDN